MPEEAELPAAVSVGDLAFRPCPTPRPNDEVIWYQHKAKLSGILIGHSPEGRPVIRNQFGITAIPENYDCIRLDDDVVPVGPNVERLPPAARLMRPRDGQVARFRQLLDQSTPPGPRYSELVREIWSRGYEVYLVGGTVRDVLAGIASYDVDLVTTMPTVRAFSLVKGMYGQPQQLALAAMRNGHLRLGGAVGSADPFIDLVTFKHSLVGTVDAIFSDDFEFDVGNRDFACNSVYFDPINEVLVDPTGRGVSDSESAILSWVADAHLRTRLQLGQVVVRLFKFMCRGLVPSDQCLELVHVHGGSYLGALDAVRRANYIRGQLFGKGPAIDRSATLEVFRRHVTDVCDQGVCAALVDPLLEQITA